MPQSASFEILTPTMTMAGTLEHRGGEWIVADIDKRIRSMIGKTAEEIKIFCEGQNWKIKKS